MQESLQKEPLSEKETALAALFLLKQAPTGKAPTLFEIDAWRQDRLQEPRASEVMSYIANQSEYYQMWRDLLESQSLLDSVEQEETSVAVTEILNERSDVIKTQKPGLLKQLNDWILSLMAKPVLMGGGVMAALTVALLVPMMMSQQPTYPFEDSEYGFEYYTEHNSGDIPMPWLIVISKGLDDLLGDVEVQDPDKHHFRLGLGQVVLKLNGQPDSKWLQWQKTLPSEPLNCETDDILSACHLQRRKMIDFGKWSLLLYLACQDKRLSQDPAFWQQQQDILSLLRQEEENKSGELMQRFINQTKFDNRIQLCASVESFVENNR